MNISSHEEYGLRCVLRLARNFGKGPMAASKIAEAEGISVEYVSKFMHLLRKAGVITAVRGIQGGFSLAQAPAELKLSEVLVALDPKGLASQDFCSKFSGKNEVCNNHAECSLRPLWSFVTYYFESILKRITLKDLLENEVKVKQRIEEILLEGLQQRREVGNELSFVSNQ